MPLVRSDYWASYKTCFCGCLISSASVKCKLCNTFTAWPYKSREMRRLGAGGQSMSDTPEGLAGKKWSLYVDSTGQLLLMQGNKTIASIVDPEAKHLLVSAPQLWTEANEILKTTKEVMGTDDLPVAVARLANIVAKAVNKDDWRKVSQA